MGSPVNCGWCRQYYDEVTDSAHCPHLPMVGILKLAEPTEMGWARIRAANGDIHQVTFACSACKRALIWSFEDWKCPCGNASFVIQNACLVQADDGDAPRVNDPRGGLVEDGDKQRREFEYCPTCSGELDTGWECNQCGLDWRDWVLQPPTIQAEGEQ